MEWKSPAIGQDNTANLEPKCSALYMGSHNLHMKPSHFLQNTSSPAINFAKYSVECHYLYTHQVCSPDSATSNMGSSCAHLPDRCSQRIDQTLLQWAR